MSEPMATQTVEAAIEVIVRLRRELSAARTWARGLNEQLMVVSQRCCISQSATVAGEGCVYHRTHEISERKAG